MLSDLRFALRRLRLSPGFSALAALMFALGVGATTTVFTLINTVLLRPPERVRQPERTVAVYTSDFSGPRFGYTSYPDLLDYRAGTSGVLDLAGHMLQPLSGSTGSESFRVLGELVTGNYFAVLGVEPARGRLLAEGGAASEIVISHALWQRRFGAAADVVGRQLRLSGHTFTVAGIAPRGFTGTNRGIGVELWLPLEAVRILDPAEEMLTGRGDRGLFLVGRLRPGAELVDAQSRLAVVAGRLHAEHRDAWTDVTGAARAVTVLGEREARVFPSIRGSVRGFLAVLMGVAALVLLVCCANLANLLLARGSARRREMAIRLALGGGRARLVRQLLTEGLVLGLIGGALGVLVAAWATQLLGRLEPPVPVPVALDFSVDARILLFAVAATVAVTLVSTLAPALRATRLDAGEGLRGDTGATPAGGRVGMRDALVVVQVAVSLVVLAAAGLVLGSLREAVRIDPGFATTGVALMRVELGVQGYDEERGRRFYEELLRGVRALPGVEAASLAELVPLGFSGQRRGLDVEGYQPRPGEEMEFGVNAVSPDYFRTMGVGLVRGRAFEERDRPGTTPVAIVNESFAQRFWPGADPIGRRIVIRDVAREIVGVARDGKYVSLGEAPVPYYYLPWRQWYESDMVLQVRTAGDSRTLLPLLAAQARSLDVELPVETTTVEEHLGYALLPQRVGAIVLGGFGGIGVLLAALGLYGVMSYLVTQRTAEIGIRMALGATHVGVRWMVLRRGLGLTAVGLALGVLGALVAARFISAFLLGVSPTDPAILAAVVALFTAVAMAATWLPARRATRVDPVIALRSE
ncbi:MAG: ABC transporter permease [Gemmatimonadales bacterium]|nr:ABC transporter permease [Gemmatimonadales bacterium]